MRYYSTKKKKYKRGDMVFSENSPCDGMYIINSGRVRVFKTMGQPESMREVELCVLGPRAMFGEMAMIDESKRSASVQAIEPTECTIITRKVFEDQLSRIPPWMVNMIRILVTRLRETNDKLRTLVEQYTALPDDDTGSILTVDDKHSGSIVGSMTREEESSPQGDPPPPQKPRNPLSGMIVMGDSRHHSEKE